MKNDFTITKYINVTLIEANTKGAKHALGEYSGVNCPAVSMFVRVFPSNLLEMAFNRGLTFNTKNIPEFMAETC